MITGAHFLLYTTDPDADRRFIRDVLGFRGVDAGGGWLIFALPPAELAVHPSEEDLVQEHAGEDVLGAVLYLLCDDIHDTVAWLERKQVECGKIGTAEWGHYTTLALPSGGRIGLYQPTHPTPLR
jgi:catechol 2,3-dioxygenase-like lactoylglutathione lyase family enzyme